MSRWPPRLLAFAGGLTLLLVVFLLYAGTLHAPFVFDDTVSIVEDAHVRSLWPPLEALRSEPGSNAHGRPLVALSLAANYAMGGLNVFGYRLVNVLLHGLVGSALYLVAARALRSAGRSDPPGSPNSWAFAIALTWTVHPLASDAVNLVVSRNEQGLALFYLATLYCSLRVFENPANWWWTLLASLACLLGMASKEAMISAPLAVLLYDRCFVAGTFRKALRLRPGLYAGLALGWLLLALLVLGGDRGESVGFDLRVTPWRYGLEQGAAVLRYLQLCVWPSPLIYDYGDWNVYRGRPTTQVETGVVLILLAVCLLALWKRRPLGYLGFVFFAILAPSSSVIPLTGEVVAEHRMYLPLAAVLASIALVLRGIMGWISAARPNNVRAFGLLTLILASALILALARSTLARNADYESALSIWEDTARKHPINYRAHRALGLIHLQEGRLEQAARALDRSVRLNPKQVDARVQLGFALEALGRGAEAEAHFREALRLNPRKPQELYEDSLEALRAGSWQGAMLTFEQVLRLKPEHVGARVELALLYSSVPDARQRKSGEAIRLATSVINGASSPRADALDALAAAFAERGEYKRAQETARQAIRISEAAGSTELSSEIEQRLAFYEAGKPYRLPTP